MVWMVTIPAERYSWGDLIGRLKTMCSEVAGQVEEGTSETKYRHWQLTFRCNKRTRFTTLKMHVFSGDTHIEEVRNPDASFNYTTKSDTRVEGPFIWPEPIKKKIDLLRHEHCVIKKWQHDLLEEINGEPSMRGVIWIWEPDGCMGKSRLTRHISMTGERVFVGKGKKSDIYFALDHNVRTIIIDLPRPDFHKYVNDGLYTMLEEIKDGCVFSGKYESGVKWLDPVHVIVFANQPPDTSVLSADKWDIRKVVGNVFERE